MADHDRTPPPPSAPPTLLDAETVRADDDVEAGDAPPFEPLFTLLTNNTTNATVHPRVHYLFTDDDTSLLANAASDPSHRALVVDLIPTTQNPPPSSTLPSSSAATSPQPQAPAAKGWAVSWASSLSADFAVTGSDLSLHQGDGDGDGAVMLRVEGVEREPVDLRGGGEGSLPNSGSGTVGREDVDVLVEEFKRRMGVLKKVVAEGETRRDVVGREVEEEGGDDEETSEANTGDKEVKENE